MKSNQLQTVQQFYPKAQPINHVFQKVNDAAINLGVKSAKTVYAVSFCSDELNNIQFPWNERFAPFILGGLGGYPFGGLTGMGAFAAHVPADGVAVIFYGPHIGITNDGTVGKINRTGQKIITGCCGSLTAALQKLLNADIQGGYIDDEDYQQNKIEQILLNQKDRIQNADQQVLEAVDVVYEAIDNKINELIGKTTFLCKNIIKAGGIVINSDKNGEAFWAPRKFEIID